MAREIDRLTSAGVRRLTEKGLHPDGNGLYLQVTKNGAKSWVFRYVHFGRQRYHGLGSEQLVGLTEARAKTLECRRLLAAGQDPVEVNKKQKPEPAPPPPPAAITFREAAERYVAAMSPSWKNTKHVAQWPSTLKRYVYPILGDKPVDTIDTDAVVKVIQPIWQTKPETASRVRGRIQSVLDWATAHGHRAGDNPARWTGHLDKILPARSKVKGVKHHPALPYVEIGVFMAKLRLNTSMTSIALQFTILTAARTGEALGATWGEFDLKAGTWTVPAERMKAHREHRAPLTRGALDILKAIGPGKPEGHVFAGAWAGQSLSGMAMLMLLRRMGRTDLTVHGFRSTFRDWAAEQSDAPAEVAEMALAHTVGNKVEAAYRRGDLFEKRRELMAEWSRFCGAESAPKKRQKAA